MIDLTAGAYLVRTASVFDYNGDYTFMFVWAYLTSGTFGRGIVMIGHDDLSDYDGLETDGSTNKLRDITRVASGSQVQTSDSSTAIAVDDTKYYTALRRTGNLVEVLLGTTPDGMTVQCTGTLSDAGRAAAEQILFNGYQVSGAHSGVGFLGRVRAFTEARSDASIKAEMKKNQPVSTTALWGNWPVPDNTDLNDDSGNARHFTGSGTINNGPALPDEGRPPIVGLMPPLG